MSPSLQNADLAKFREYKRERGGDASSGSTGRDRTGGGEANIHIYVVEDSNLRGTVLSIAIMFD